MAQYPAPLSSKSLTKLYIETGLSESQISFLHDFFLSAANLYGAITLHDLWEVYVNLAGKTVIPIIRKKDLIAASSVFRREELPYFVFEINELYSEESQNDINREIVHEGLISYGNNKLDLYYCLQDVLRSNPYYVPSDFLKYKDRADSPADCELKSFFGNLKITAEKYIDPISQVSCPCKGAKNSKLKDADFLFQREQYELDFATGSKGAKKANDRYIHYLKQQLNKSIPERFVDILHWSINVGTPKISDILSIISEELCEAGVQISKNQLNVLGKLIQNYNNTSHLMCLRGWTPDDFSEHMR